MATLLLGKSTTKVPPDEVGSIKKAIQPEVIEISSDDDTDGEQDLISVHTTPQVRHQDHLRPPTIQARHTKRQKITHNIDTHAASLLEIPKQDRTTPLSPNLIDGYPNFDDFRPVYPLGVITGFGLESDSADSILERQLQSMSPGSTTWKAQVETVVVPDSTMRKKKVVICPYYQDHKLHTLMYRGPGHEDFPVVFGTDQSHQQVVTKWDQKQAKRAARGYHRKQTGSTSAATLYEARLVESSDEEPEEHFGKLSDVETLCLTKVREILPDIQQDFVVRKMRLPMPTTILHDGTDDLGVHISVEEIVMYALEHDSYPKEKKKHEDEMTVLGKTVPLIKGDPDTDSYRLDCVGVLASCFERVPTYEINKIFQEMKSLHDAYIHLEHTEETYYSMTRKPYKRLQKPRTRLETKYQTFTNRSHLCVPWRNIVNELQAARQYVARERIRLAQEAQSEALEAKNLERHRENGSTVECRCCFDEEVALNRVVGCEGQEIHWFCFACVKGLAESQLGIMRYEMLCMDGNGCKAPLTRHGLTQAVPIQVLDKLDFLQQHAEVMAAGIEGLEQCEHCEFQGICDPIGEDPVFRCRNPDCGRLTCRKCHEDAHAPKTCEEVNQDKSLSARHVVEEARSEAMMRVCPGCKIKIVKESGCNKITCTKCYCMSCFVCKEAIVNKHDGGYQHFNAPGAKCSLYDRDFDRHDVDANKAEKEAIAKIRAANSSLDEKQLQVEVNMNQKQIRKTDEPGAAIRAAYDVQAMQNPYPLALPVENGPPHDLYQPWAQAANQDVGGHPNGAVPQEPALLRQPLPRIRLPAHVVPHLTTMQGQPSAGVRRAMDLARAAVGFRPTLDRAMLDNAVDPNGATAVPVDAHIQHPPRTVQAQHSAGNFNTPVEYNLNHMQNPGVMTFPPMQHDVLPLLPLPMVPDYQDGDIQANDNQFAPTENYDFRAAEAWLRQNPLPEAGEDWW